MRKHARLVHLPHKVTPPALAPFDAGKFAAGASAQGGSKWRNKGKAYSSTGVGDGRRIPALPQNIAQQRKTRRAPSSVSPSFSPRKHDLSELGNLLGLLRDYQVAIEFRNCHWFLDKQLAATLGFLRTHEATLVLVDAPSSEHFMIAPSDLDEITNPHLSYLRLHGRNVEAYLKGKTVAARFDYDYSDEEIEEVVVRSQNLARSAREVHVVFNNNNLDYAPRAASRLRAALGQILKAPPRQEIFLQKVDFTNPTSSRGHLGWFARFTNSRSGSSQRRWVRIQHA